MLLHHDRARIREYKGLETAEVSPTEAPEKDEGEQCGDSASLKPRDLESSFRVVNSKDPLATG